MLFYFKKYKPYIVTILVLPLFVKLIITIAENPHITSSLSYSFIINIASVVFGIPDSIFLLKGKEVKVLDYLFFISLVLSWIPAILH